MSNETTSCSILFCNLHSKLSYIFEFCDHTEFKQDHVLFVMLLYVLGLLLSCIMMSGFIIMVSFIIRQCQNGRNSDIEML